MIEAKYATNGYESPRIPDEHTTDEKITTPCGSFSVTDMTREQMEAAGYAVHHTSDDGKHLIMGKGTHAFAVAAEQPTVDTLQTRSRRTKSAARISRERKNNLFTPNSKKTRAKKKPP